MGHNFALMCRWMPYAFMFWGCYNKSKYNGGGIGRRSRPYGGVRYGSEARS